MGDLRDGAGADVKRVSFVVYGAPRTKKTHNRVVTKGGVRVLPSRAWSEWVKTAQIAVRHQPSLPARPYNCRALFYRDAKRGDAVGYYQGLADLLEKRGVIPDDKWLVAWDGSRLEVDRDNPRVEITLTPLKEPKGRGAMSEILSAEECERFDDRDWGELGDFLATIRALRAERDEAVARLRAYWAWHDSHGSGHESVVPGYAASEHYTTEEALELERLHDDTGAWLARTEEGNDG